MYPLFQNRQAYSYGSVERRRYEIVKMRRLWKKTAIITAAAILLGASNAVPEFDVVYASNTQQQIDKTKDEMNKLENELDKTQTSINSLEKKTDKLLKELESLNNQLMEVTANLESLEQQISDKEQEISETQEALYRAKETEAWQHESMVAMMRCMYEMNQNTYLSALLEAVSLSEFLNKADNIEKIVAYSQQKMQEYQETRMLIEMEEERLQAEWEELGGLYAQAEDAKSKVNQLISDTSKNVQKNEDAIAEAEKRAKEYEAELKKQEENLEVLKKKLAEEIALSQAAAKGVWRDISQVTFETNDRYLLANLIYCEAGGEPYEGQVAVGAVVMNRVLSGRFPNTVAGVIYQKNQFSPVKSGRLALALQVNKATEKCYRAADEAMAGVTNVGTCLFFRTPIPGLTGISIGGHIFY